MRHGACVFHHPFPVSAEASSGSRVRPYQMMRAFEGLGYEVVAVTGYAQERHAAATRVLEDLKKGRKFDFVYSESHTLPAALTEPHHLPTHPRLDARFLAALKARKVPVGLFYRDVLWRFDGFAQHYPFLKRIFATWFYEQEWRDILRVTDHLFLPSLEMAKALPTRWPNTNVSALPPGVESRTERERRQAAPTSRPLELFYVGGVNPPYYDLRPLFRAVGGDDRLHLTICCRPAEWESVRERYPSSDNIDVVHVSGKDLEGYYARADAVVILREPHPYLEFAMPVKVFEALAYGLPIITSDTGATATFLSSNSLGWVVGSIEEFRDLVSDLLLDRSLFERAYARIAATSTCHTWDARARQVATTLLEI